MKFPVASFFQAVLCTCLVYFYEKEIPFSYQKTFLCLIVADTEGLGPTVVTWGCCASHQLL